MAPKKQTKQAQQQREQEERKLKEEQEAQARKEAEQAQQAQILRLEKEQAQRLALQRKQADNWHEQVLKTEKELDAALQEKESWQSFLKCDQKPDPLTVSQISCFISQYESEGLRDVRESNVESLLESVNLADDMIQLLKNTKEVLASDLDKATAQNCDRFSLKLKAVRKLKTDSVVDKFLIAGYSLLE